MTFTQLQYIVAVDTFRHFGMAAQSCFVSQPTLSMQIQKLEEKLGVQIFDRNTFPIVPTEIGVQIIAQARKILSEQQVFEQIIHNNRQMIAGDIKLGIIPTLAPYLLPYFLSNLVNKYPQLKVQVYELTTEQLIAQLINGRMDMAILVTPLQEKQLMEHVLFYEEMVAYVSPQNSAFQKNYVLPQDIDPNKLWLLEEGHCFRNQIMHLCELRKHNKDFSNIEYEAGSVETLRRMVDRSDGITILPELATIEMPESQLNNIRYFKQPAPVREVSLVTHTNFVKHKIAEAIKTQILDFLPPKIAVNKPNQRVIPV